MQSKYIRTIGIVLAVILSMAADFLHRWVGQPIQPQLSEVACRGRDHWQSHNGRDLFFAGVLLAERHDRKRSEMRCPCGSHRQWCISFHPFPRSIWQWRL